MTKKKKPNGKKVKGEHHPLLVKEVTDVRLNIVASHKIQPLGRRSMDTPTLWIRNFSFR